MKNELKQLHDYVKKDIDAWSKRTGKVKKAPFPSDAPCYYCNIDLKLNPDLIILDHIFGGNSGTFSNGLDILKEIKKQSNSVKVIILSSINDEAVKSEYISNGAAQFIEKNDYFIDALMEVLDEETAN